MMSWIIENKEWIFSGIGVAFIGILIAAIRFFYQRRRKPNEIYQHTRPSVTTSSKPSDSISLGTEGIHIARDNITPSKIVEKVKSVPPLQRKDIARHYYGRRLGSDLNIDI